MFKWLFGGEIKVIVDPKELSDNELEQIRRAVDTEIKNREDNEENKIKAACEEAKKLNLGYLYEHKTMLTVEVPATVRWDINTTSDNVDVVVYGLDEVKEIKEYKANAAKILYDLQKICEKHYVEMHEVFFRLTE